MNIKKLLIIAAVCVASCQNFALGNESLLSKAQDTARNAADSVAGAGRDANAAIHGKANDPASKAERKAKNAKDKIVRKAKNANDIANQS